MTDGVLTNDFEGWTLETVGEVAKDCGMPLGTIVCPHCGVISHGTIYPYCRVCEKPYWSKWRLEEVIEGWF